MKQKILFIPVLILIAAVLVGLNAASYTQKQQTPDSELRPNRSTYNGGSTGTRAFYSLLAESGRQVVRWQEPATDLQSKRRGLPSTFVIVGATRREITDAEATALLRWVSGGGRLVIVDREPPGSLAVTTCGWKLDVKTKDVLRLREVDPADQQQMTALTPAARPVQPTLYTAGVNAVQPSRFASGIVFQPLDDASPRPTPVIDAEEIDVENLAAPVAHVAADGRVLLAEVPFGSGRIVFLSDPYIIANRGISLVDNAQLALNLVSNSPGPIAFDEYHQGFGGDNKFLEFFAGTPVIAIFLQCCLLAGFVFFSRSRRFARPTPAIEPDRLSKLEYVSAMAQLQQRTRSYDLAIENLYRDLRRRSARLLGVDNNTIGRRQFAEKIAEKAHSDPDRVEELMFYCDEVIYGEPTDKRRTLKATREIREIEKALGIRKRTVK